MDITTDNNNEQLIETLLSFFNTEFPGTGIELTTDTNLLTNWLVDSLGIVNTTLFIEKQFGVNIGRADIKAENFQTIGHLVKFIRSNLSGQ